MNGVKIEEKRIKKSAMGGSQVWNRAHWKRQKDEIRKVKFFEVIITNLKENLITSDGAEHAIAQGKKSKKGRNQRYTN